MVLLVVLIAFANLCGVVGCWVIVAVVAVALASFVLLLRLQLLILVAVVGVVVVSLVLLSRLQLIITKASLQLEFAFL